ncbi:MAG: TatD family hydrolase [Patescibacteria group bacterium]
MRLEYIDIHSHIHDREFDQDRDAVLARMRENQVGTIAVGTHHKSSQEAVELALKEESVYAAVGLHPTDTRETFDTEAYKLLAQNKKVVAIGECGLDYFRGGIDMEEKKRQGGLFQNQIELALSVDLPLMIHGRPSRTSMDAYHDILEILNSYKNEKGNLRGNVHFFAGDIDIAKKFLDLGFTMSFTGVITFARDYDEVIRYIPPNSIMSETDAPYVAPVPYRGGRNEPVYVIEVVRQIAQIRREKESLVGERLLNNAKSIFLLD